MQENQQTPIHLTVRQFCEKHQAYTHGGIRSLIFNERVNGLRKSGAVIRVGRRVIIDEQRFFAWVDSLQQKSA